MSSICSREDSTDSTHHSFLPIQVWAVSDPEFAEKEGDITTPEQKCRRYTEVRKPKCFKKESEMRKNILSRLLNSEIYRQCKKKYFCPLIGLFCPAVRRQGKVADPTGEASMRTSMSALESAAVSKTSNGHHGQGVTQREKRQ